MWQTPPLSSVVFVDGIVFLVLTYLYLNIGSLSKMPQVKVPNLGAYEDPSLSFPPGYGQSIWLEHPDGSAVAFCQLPVSAASSDGHNVQGGLMHAQNPLEV